MQTANRVAINTIIQYVKLIVNVLVGLISVRILLNALGADDYGIYDVVGGVIALLAFVNSSLSQSSIRFLSVSIGKSDLNDTRSVFNNCFWVHLLVSLFVVIVFVLLGTVLFDHFLSIPKDRLPAARIVYHCMILTLFLQISVTPFNALILSHENFFVISLISILDSFLKLGIAFAVKYSTVDKLVLYGMMMAIVTILNSIISIGYVNKKYNKELHIGHISLKESKVLLNFVGWTVLDIISQLSTKQGYAIMFNKFFGTTINAVYALSRQIEGNLYYLSASVIDSMKPQIMKSYGDGNYERMIRLSLTSGKMGFSMMSIITIPLLIMMPSILEIWLGTVPAGTVFFSRMMVMSCMVEQLTKGLVHACQATGNIKLFSIIVSFIRFLALPLSIISFILGMPAGTAMIIYLSCETIGSASRVLIMSKITSLRITSFIKTVFLQILPPVVLVSLIGYLIYMYNTATVICCINFIICALLYSVMCYYITLDKIERAAINNIIKSLFNKFKGLQ